MSDETPAERPDGIGDARQTEKDTSYSPASEREMRAREADAETSTATEDPEIDEGDVRLLPGTGGQDDPGDVRVDPAELDPPRETGAR